jgi:uncharacterized protein
MAGCVSETWRRIAEKGKRWESPIGDLPLPAVNRDDKGLMTGGLRKSKSEVGRCVYNLTRESFLCLNVSVADNPIKRLIGLLGKVRLRSDEGLWIVPSCGIHTIGLLFPIDLIYLDSNNEVIWIVEQLATFRIAPIVRKADSVLALKTGTVYSSNTSVGDQLVICSPDQIQGRLTQNLPRQQPVNK